MEARSKKGQGGKGAVPKLPSLGCGISTPAAFSLCYSPAITLHVTTVVMTTHYPSSDKSPASRGVRLPLAPQTPSLSLNPLRFSQQTWLPIWFFEQVIFGSLISQGCLVTSIFSYCVRIPFPRPPLLSFLLLFPLSLILSYSLLFSFLCFPLVGTGG